jgi:hypothetical protein
VTPERLDEIEVRVRAIGGICLGEEATGLVAMARECLRWRALGESPEAVRREIGLLERTVALDTRVDTIEAGMLDRLLQSETNYATPCRHSALNTCAKCCGEPGGVGLRLLERTACVAANSAVGLPYNDRGPEARAQAAASILGDRPVIELLRAAWLEVV